jgi:N-methylhydantoinase A
MGRVDARDDRLDDAMAQLATSARRRLGTEDAAVQPALDCRYAGQSHELTVDFPDSGASLPRPRITREQIDARFAAEHVRRNGYARPGTPVEVVALRVRASLAAPLTVADLPVVERARVVGPRVVAEADCTVWVPPGWVAETGPLGAWVIARG